MFNLKILGPELQVAFRLEATERTPDALMSQLTEVLRRAEEDLRTIGKALAAADCHADALRFFAYASLVAHDVPEKLAHAEAALEREITRGVPVAIPESVSASSPLTRANKKCG